MKERNYLYTAIFLTIFSSCSTWKNGLVAHGDNTTVVKNAVTDFLHADKLSKVDTIYYVQLENISVNILGLSIMGTDNKVAPGPDDKIGTNNHPGFPTRYIDQNGKLFLWYDSAYNITTELINTLSKYRCIDSLNVNGFVGIPPYSNNDRKKGAEYYFCKCDLRHYKKIHSSKAMVYYPPPRIACKCNPE